MISQSVLFLCFYPLLPVTALKISNISQSATTLALYCNWLPLMFGGGTLPLSSKWHDAASGGWRGARRYGCIRRLNVPAHKNHLKNLISDIPRNQFHRLLEIEANSRLNKLLKVWERNVGVHYLRGVPPRQKLPFIVYNIAWDQQSQDKGCLPFTRANR